MKNKFIQRVLIAVFIGAIVINVGSTVWYSRDTYLSFDYWDRYPLLKKTYENSQYVRKNIKYWFHDELVNAYAGGSLIRGVNPTYIVADTPPLGKYLIGLSALLFNNENYATLLSLIGSLFLLFLLGKQIFQSNLWALIPPFFLSFEKLFLSQLILTPLYDIMQLVFILGAFYFFNKGLLSNKRIFVYFVIAQLFLGFFISTKFFITGSTIIGAWMIVLFLQRDWKRLTAIAITTPVSVLVLLFSYIQAFILNPNIREFLGIQKWVFLYHKSQLILPFSIWPLILFNKWYVWFGDQKVIADTQWMLTWPIITIGSLITIVLYLLRKYKKNTGIEPLMVWVILYFLFFSFGQIASRYLLILLPMLYLITLFGIKSFIDQYVVAKKKLVRK